MGGMRRRSRRMSRQDLVREDGDNKAKMERDEKKSTGKLK